MANGISALIITFNEERNIERCIRSLFSVADEIIVLDSFSTDATPQICLDLGVVLLQRKWEGYAASKNFLNQHAKFDYILSLDADEVLSEELLQHISQAKKTGLSGVYSLNRLTNYCGKWIYHSGWYPDWKVRLFPAKTSKWVGDLVHEELDFPTSLPVQRLKGDVFHYSYISYVDHRQRADRYSHLTAQKYVSKGKKPGIFAPYLSCMTRFFSMYVLKLGFLDGYMGFKIAQISGLSNIVKYKEVRRLNRENNKV